MYLHKPAERGSIDTTRNCVGAGSRKIASRKPTIVSPIKAHVLSTVLNLFFIPALYVLLKTFLERFSKSKKRPVEA